ncbi:MAG: TIGR02757 family protein [Bacteroidetes bacterium]|nr:TIGR02757 family protein [Bacteroidota bacterium]
MLSHYLTQLYDRFNDESFIKTDPISIVHAYRNPVDIEWVGLLVSAYSFGRVSLILRFFSDLMPCFGDSLVGGLTEMNEKDIRQIGESRPYRFYSGADLATLLMFIRMMVLEGKSPADFLEENHDGLNDRALYEEWGRFLEKSDRWTPGTRYMFPDPAGSSGRKRFMMYYRWMVRQDRIDFGLWTHLSPSSLIFPLDTHTSRLCYYLGLSEARRTDMRTATLITQRLKEIDPKDPVKFDFGLSRLGILNHCPSARQPEICEDCSLYPVCAR